MNAWQLHWLEAEGDLGPFRTTIESEVEAARARVAAVIEPPRLDILVQRLPGMVIPELGLAGAAYRKTLFALTLDPDNPNCAECLGNGTLQRQVVHEVHHCLRMAACGYGRSLGEALVSEGLAGQFVRHLFDTPPEPWECAVDATVARAHWPDPATLAATNYGHDAWFFGRGDRFPRWLGYTIGYRIVGAWLGSTEPTGAEWFSIPAATILASGAAAPP